MTKGKDQPQAYGDETYWDNRYSQDAGTFDWYQRYAGLAPLINMYIPKQNKILMVGCGNAAISEDMVCDGYQDIVNIDISAVVIEAMREKYKDMPQLQCNLLPPSLLSAKILDLFLHLFSAQKNSVISRWSGGVL
jgi:SAM-dependent methyltransferase